MMGLLLINRPEVSMTATYQQIAAAFSPKVVAVIGARKADDYAWLRNMRGFRGKVYSVQIDPNDIPGIEEMGVPNYKSLAEIPDQVDYAVIAVPRRVVPFVLKDVIAAGIKTVHMFTSGFSETAEEEGIELEATVKQMAEDAGLLIIGPNCMGVFNADNGMRFMRTQDIDVSGSVAVIAQSGGHASSLTTAGQQAGVGIHTTISFGNGIILDSPDLLEYFADDPKTKLICAYIEGPKDGKRFFEKLKYAASRKPVVIWKGGQTDAGQRMATSHTGSLAGSMAVWNAMVKQAGAIRADSLEEALDITKALAYLDPFTDDGIGMIGGSGGQSVAMSDSFAKHGMRVPRLTEPTLEAMGSFFQLIGASYFNPVDVGGINRTSMETILDLLGLDPEIGSVGVLVSPMVLGGGSGKRTRNTLTKAQRATLEQYKNSKDRVGKPFFGMFWAPVPHKDGKSLELIDEAFQEMGLPIFLNPERAAAAISKVVEYYRLHSDLVAK
tara:strand:- start:369 stop:1856 length:1488 start_codon:yes stop_codon:yes gene_type:complete